MKEYFKHFMNDIEMEDNKNKSDVSYFDLNDIKINRLYLIKQQHLNLMEIDMMNSLSKRIQKMIC